MRTPSHSRPDPRRIGVGFLKRESGAYTVFAVVGFAMLMVVIGLVMDVGRVMNVHSQASSYADRVALAAAAELDGWPDAIDRAVFRAQQVGQNGDRLTLSGDDQVGIGRLVFMSSIVSDPSNPDERSPLSGDNVVLTVDGDADPVGLATPEQAIAARYVMVETTPETENFLFFGLFGGSAEGRTSATVRPQAVAGFRRAMCNSAPVMVCNPAEGPQIGASFNPENGFPTTLGLQAGGTWNTDTYGLLRVNSTVLGIPINLNLRNLLGGSNPGTACYGDSVRALRSSVLSLQLGLSLPALRTEVAAGLNQRTGEDLPVAVVNCREHQTRLLFGLDVPVEAYVRVRLDGVGAVNANLNLGAATNSPPPAGTPDPLREYPVLVR